MTIDYSQKPLINHVYQPFLSTSAVNHLNLPLLANYSLFIKSDKPINLMKHLNALLTTITYWLQVLRVLNQLYHSNHSKTIGNHLSTIANHV